jgi:hypothetical protein
VQQAQWPDGPRHLQALLEAVARWRGERASR